MDFEYCLALELKMTVSEIRQMPNDEFIHWNVYLARRAQHQQQAYAKAQIHSNSRR